MPLDPQFIDLFYSWQENPRKFVAEAIPGIQLSHQQEEGFDQLRKLISAKIKLANSEPMTEEEREYAKKIGISIMSGKGTGKDTFAALCILYFLSCFSFPKIPCTAPTGHQLKDVLWAEINKWLRQSKVAGDLTWQSDKVFHNAAKGKEWFAVARTCNPRATAEEQAETLAGFHEDYLMILIDEASRVPDPVFTALESTLTGKCNFAILIFNPTRTKGFARDSQFKDRSRWITLHWDAEESERVPKSFVEERAKKYGRDSNFFRIFVKGLPPMSGEKLLIEWDWAEEAIDRDVEPIAEDILVFGIDVGAGGDSSVIQPRRGPVFGKCESNDTSDSEVLTNWIIGQIRKHEPDVVMVDTIGVGWAIEGNLRTRCPDVKVIGINVQEAAADDTRFYRLRDELCWSLREKFEKRVVSIQDDPLLIGEMTSIKYDDERPDGKIKVESKKDMKKRGVESPNRFDAAMLTEYYQYETLRKMGGAKRDSWRKGSGESWKTA